MFHLLTIVFCRKTDTAENNQTELLNSKRPSSSSELEPQPKRSPHESTEFTQNFAWNSNDKKSWYVDNLKKKICTYILNHFFPFFPGNVCCVMMMKNSKLILPSIRTL